MSLRKIMEERHSVRSYEDRAIEGEVKEELLFFIEMSNRGNGLHIQLVTDEPQAFGGLRARYGNFTGVRNYLALVGRKSPFLEEKCGYFGEGIVLKAQQLGLNTCWAAQTYSKVKGAYEAAPGEKLCCVIAVGYGTTQGIPHKVKPIEALCKVEGQMPEWFRKGMEAAQLAPTALNQQKFMFFLKENRVLAKAGIGFYTKIDLGIAKYHFELGADSPGWRWEE